jgi:hypothetical protein
MARSGAPWYLLLLLVLALPRPAGAQAVSEGGAAPPRRIEADLQLERRLLSLDLAGYGESRAREEAARTRLGEVLKRLDQALAGEALTLGALEALDDQARAARLAAQSAAERVDRQVERVEERMRRIAFLSGEGRTRTAQQNPLTGRWRVSVDPGGRAGTFELRQSGTVVTGRYRMEGGGEGSLHGTYAQGVLKIDRIDARGGRDITFLGNVDEAAGQITGVWQGRELARGEPAYGGWSAVRVAAAGGAPP